MSWSDLNQVPEQERLYLLLEEMGEVTQIIGKILRHGYESCHPDNPGVTNRQLLEKELGDVRFAMALLEESRDVSGPRIHEASVAKADKMANIGMGALLHHFENVEHAEYALDD